MIYEELKKEDFYIRTFDENIDQNDLVWHRDLEDRTIIPIENEDWMIQIDEKLPIKIENEIFIPKTIFHRLIKGKGSLKIKLIKHI